MMEAKVPTTPVSSLGIHCPDRGELGIGYRKTSSIDIPPEPRAATPWGSPPHNPAYRSHLMPLEDKGHSNLYVYGLPSPAI
ncbi:hypothetical protein J6590_085528 [Homalodisca vitripennis]|nr:hypothetical protein J6590_085528 [Homalodisca vitripennis]